MSKGSDGVQRRHRMPFGAEVAEGGVRFRLWGPSAGAVALRLEAGPGPRGNHAMTPAGDGWWEATIEGVGAGTRYRFEVGGDMAVPDPASRFQPEGVHGPSEVIDPAAFAWPDADWPGRPWHEAVFYELHVGAFTEEGTFEAATRRLDALAELGVTAVELMPVAAAPGARNWGYDGTHPFAPNAVYGRPEDMKALVAAAHERGLMVFLDVVYNHFGPEGNYLHAHAAPFFTERHRTPWGQAIDFDGPSSRTVRDFFIHNALYWLEEYHLDGLRLDAVHAIRDDSRPGILEELADAVRVRFRGRRQVHLVLENDDNAAHLLARDPGGRPKHYVAQWNDDSHHAFHVLLTGEDDGYYGDYVGDPAAHLARALAEGFAYQGEASAYRNGRHRGEPSGHLPPTAFVNFLQNHDQVGNRALGERLAELADPAALRAAMAVLLLAPPPPLLFMGEDWGAEQRFPFFCDFGPDLAPRVTEGRRAEFAHFAQFGSEAAQAEIPDPNAPATFRTTVLNWADRDDPPHSAWCAYVRGLLDLRHREIVPLIPGIAGNAGAWRVLGHEAFMVSWRIESGQRLNLMANLTAHRAEGEATAMHGNLLFESEPGLAERWQNGLFPPFSVGWWIDNDNTKQEP